VCVESEEDRILGSYYRTQWNRNGEGKGRWSVKLARTKKCKRCQKVLGPCKLLQEVYQGLCSNSKANEYADEKGCEVAMGGEQQKAFNKLKEIFTTRPVLVAPDLDKEFRIEAGASNYAMGGVLSMKCSDKLWRPVAFISKSLSDTERNYEIHNKEILAVVRCLEV